MPEAPTPTAYEVAVAAIAAAGTAAEAEAAYDAAKADVTAAEGERLQAAVDRRIAAIEMMARADEQKMALADAAGMIDTSDLMDAADITAANAAIAALKARLAEAVDVSDADKAMYQGQVDAAETAVAAAQSSLDHAAQTMALSDAVTALQAIDLSDLSTKDKIDAADAAIAELDAALDAATELSNAEKTAAMTELATANRTVMTAQGTFDTAAQRTALGEAVATLAALDLDNLMTQEQIDAAVAAITGLNLALEAATNLTDAQKRDAIVDMTVAQRRVDSAEMALAENVDDQRMALSEAGMALAEIDLADLDTQEKIDAADAAVDALEMALMAASHLSDSEKAMYQTQMDTATETVRTAQTGMDRDGRMMAQRTAITNAVEMARTAVGMVDADATDAEVTAAEEAIAALKAAIEGAEDLAEGDTDVASARGTLDTLEPQLASAKTSRMMAMEASAEEERKAMTATAATLFASIMPEAGTFDATGSIGAAERYAGWNAGGNIVVGDGSELTSGVVELFEDKTATVAPLHGWQGRRFAVAHDRSGNLSNSDYEAVVYSDVGEPTMGAKFNSGATDGVGFDLNSDGALAIAAATNLEARIASPSFDHSVGYKAFKLPESNLGGATSVTIAGSYYGVAGTYACTPADAADGCRVNRTANGYVLVLSGTGGGTWTFTPGNPDARVTEMPDMAYASFGWWLRKHGEEEGDWTASAFARPRGTVPAATDVGALTGSATYVGGAAGKYAISAPTGGTNEGGHFTATATLTAKFAASTDSRGDFLTGTIDRFKVGNDGAERDWSVNLNVDQTETFNNITNTGGSGGTATTVNANYTTWTIGGVTADRTDNEGGRGLWQAQMYETGDDGVPKVVTGIFHAEYGNSGKMVGGFGAEKR